MKQHIATLGALGCAIVLSACTTPKPYKYAIPAEARAMFGAVEVVTPVANDKITILPAQFGSTTPYYTHSVPSSVSPSAAIAGNLIVAIAIDGANQRLGIWAEEDAQPLRTALGDFKLAPAIQTDLDSALGELPWLKAAPVQLSSEDADGTADKLVAASKASALLWTPVQYNLTDKADQLVIQMRAFVFPVSTDLKQLLVGDGSVNGFRPEQDNILYRNVLTFKASMSGATTDRITNVAIWAKNDAAALRDAMKLGSAKLIEMLVEDIKTLPDHTLAVADTSPGQARELRADEGGSFMISAGGELSYATHATQTPLVKVPETKRGPRIVKTPPPRNFY